MEAILNHPKYPKGARYRVFQVAVLCLSFMLASVSVAGCLLGDLGQEFPNAPAWFLQMFITFPTIGGMLANLIGGGMATTVGKKNLCLLGIALCFVGGFGAMLMPTLALKIAIRVLAGLGVGLIQPLSASLIIDCFDGPTAQQMMGFQSACVGLGASLFSYTMAAIMVYDWHFAYFAYLYCVAFFLLVLVGVPAFINQVGSEPKVEEGPKVESSSAGSVARKALPAAAFVGCIAQFIYGLGYGALDNCLSLGAVEVGIDTTTAAAIASWGGIAALIGGIIFGTVVKFTGMKWMGAISLAINVAGLVIVGMTSTTMMWYVGVTVIKVGFCWWMPYVNFLVTDGCDETNSAMATALGFVGNSLGSFVFGYVFAFIGGLVGGLGQHQAFLYGAVMVAIAFVVVAVYTAAHKDNKQTAQAA
ncbi:MAG: MFS transporter [Clostridiales bacterium]|nr:MFS transporter [Clostridiales bacterium]